jgi:hypothetical protein
MIKQTIAIKMKGGAMVFSKTALPKMPLITTHLYTPCFHANENNLLKFLQNNI